MTKVVLCHGQYDICHFGHLKHFQKAKTYGDKLVVSVTADRFVLKGKGRPLFNERDRMEMVGSLRIVDNVILSDTEDGVAVINLIRPNFYCKGPDYAGGDVTGNLQKEKDAVESHGGKLVIIHNEIIYSSTDIMTGRLLERRIKECQS